MGTIILYYAIHKTSEKILMKKILFVSVSRLVGEACG